MSAEELAGPSALEAFLEAAPDAILVVDRDGRIVVASHHSARLFGYARDELVGRPVDLLVPDRFRTAHATHRADYVREPRTRAMGEGLTLWGRRKDGTEIPVEISLSPLPSEQGPLVISIIRDVSQRRRADAKFRDLLESAPDGIVVVDRAGAIVLVNTQTELLFGYPREELVGRPIEALVPERYKRIHVEHREGYVANPKARPMGSAAMSLFGRRRDGSEFPVEISLSPIDTEEGELVAAAIRDISERKRVENQLRSSLREKEILLKEVHHRVKNNLQIVSSMLNLQMTQLAQAEDPEIGRDAALGLLKENQARVRSIALFHEKLYQSKDLAHVDLAEYLKGVTSGVFANYGVSPDDVDLSFEVEQLELGVDAAISCGLVVNELVSNALKYAFRGRAHGAVRVVLRREGSDVVLAVSDDGVGLPPGIDLRNPSTLGLKLVSVLTEQVGGTVTLDAREGTRFVIRFDREEQR